MNESVASPVWLTGFAAVALVVLLLHMWRGWRQGPVRLLLGLCVLVTTYFAAWYGSGFLAAMLQPHVALPHFTMRIVAGAVLGLVWYLVWTSIVRVVFRRTADQSSGMVRLAYGISGAMLGLVFGLLMLWVAVMGIRLLGSVAESKKSAMRDSDASRQVGPLAESLIRLKQSIELGPAGQLVSNIDLIPQETYDTLDKMARVAARPERAQRFLRFPGAQPLSRHPKVQALVNDAEIAEMAGRGDYFSLARHERIAAAANDPEVAALLKKFEFQKALDYALQTPQ